MIHVVHDRKYVRSELYSPIFRDVLNTDLIETLVDREEDCIVGAMLFNEAEESE